MGTAVNSVDVIYEGQQVFTVTIVILQTPRLPQRHPLYFDVITVGLTTSLFSFKNVMKELKPPSWKLFFSRFLLAQITQCDAKAFVKECQLFVNEFSMYRN